MDKAQLRIHFGCAGIECDCTGEVFDRLLPAALAPVHPSDRAHYLGIIGLLPLGDREFLERSTVVPVTPVIQIATREMTFQQVRLEQCGSLHCPPRVGPTACSYISMANRVSRSGAGRKKYPLPRR